MKLGSIKNKILVLSGKGGVGKSTVSCQLAWIFEAKGLNVGLLDVDVCGPSVPLMTGTKDEEVHSSSLGWSPVYATSNLAVMSIGYMLPNEDDAVIWRGPKKNGLIKQFLTDVNWGDLDILLIDTPPGTSDEHLSLVTYLKSDSIRGAVVVTTPQEASFQDVRKEINFCKTVGIQIIGLVENMTNSPFEIDKEFIQRSCKEISVNYLGKISLDRDLLNACEQGVSLKNINPQSAALSELNLVAGKILAFTGKTET